MITVALFAFIWLRKLPRVSNYISNLDLWKSLSPYLTLCGNFVNFALRFPYAVCNQVLDAQFFREGEHDIFYYSCKAHLDELVEALKADGQEENLILAFEDKYNDIIRQMTLTESLANEFKGKTIVLEIMYLCGCSFAIYCWNSSL